MFPHSEYVVFSTLEIRHQTRTPEGDLIRPGLNSSVPSLRPCHHDTPIAVPRRASNPPPRRSRAASTVEKQSAQRHGEAAAETPNASPAELSPPLPRLQQSLTSLTSAGTASPMQAAAACRPLTWRAPAGASGSLSQTHIPTYRQACCRPSRVHTLTGAAKETSSGLHK